MFKLLQYDFFFLIVLIWSYWFEYSLLGASEGHGRCVIWQKSTIAWLEFCSVWSFPFVIKMTILLDNWVGMNSWKLWSSAEIYRVIVLSMRCVTTSLLILSLDLWESLHIKKILNLNKFIINWVPLSELAKNIINSTIYNY